MDHRFFEQKLLNDENFTPREEQALQEHLLGCAECAALAEVNFALRQVTMEAPAEGFTNRFSARLADRRKTERNRFLFGGLILLAGGIAGLFFLISPFFSASIASPSRFLVDLVSNMAAAFSFVCVFGEIGQVLFRIASGFIPLSAWVFSLVSLGGLSFFWLSSVKKASYRLQSI
jgi:hypothetical protein